MVRFLILVERFRGGIWSLRRKVANGDLSGRCDAVAPKTTIADSPYKTQDRLRHVQFVVMFGRWFGVVTVLVSTWLLLSGLGSVLS